MLTCIACSKQLGGGRGTAAAPLDPEDDDAVTPSTRQAIKSLTSQIKEMAVKASGAYRHCKPCAGSTSGRHQHYAESEAATGSERFHCAYRRAGGSTASTPGAEAGLRGTSSGEGTPSLSGAASVVAEEEAAPAPAAEKEWVAQVEPGVLITFVSLAQGGNDLKRIRFSREIFNKWQAQRWWAENYDKVMELYNVRRFNRHAVPLPTPPRSEDESLKMESAEGSPVTPPLSNERLPHSLQKQVGGTGLRYSSSDSIEHHNGNGRHYYDSKGLASTPKLSSISGAKTERSSMDASVRTTSSSREEDEDDEVDRSGELSASVSNASEQETEWVEQDEPGVYITIRAMPGGIRELRRVRFSREKFGEMHARLWWEENRARIHSQYL